MTKTKPWMETGRVVFLPIRKICPNPAQPRKVFEEEGLQELAASILQYGILQPLTVRRQEDGYELVAGERRLRAARMAGLSDVPCIVMAMDEEQSGMLALVENLQRRDLDFIEEAEGLAKLMRLYGLSQEQAAVRVGKSQSAVANKLRLLRHSNNVLDAIRENGLTERHARALLKLPTDLQKMQVIYHIKKLGMSVARTESYIDQLLQEPSVKSQRANIGSFLNNLSQTLSKIQSSGIAAVSERRETDSQIVLTITIPKT